MTYKTSYGSVGKSHTHSVFDAAGDWIGSAYSVDGGKNWFIRGLFRDTDRGFTDLQAAIEQITFLHSQTWANLVAA